MPEAPREPQTETFALGAASRLTGLTPELLRAWEKRYGVVTPLRTPGGSRRYRVQDLERLRLLKAAVDAGYRIGQVAGLGSEELERLGSPEAELRQPALDGLLAAIAGLDFAESQRLLGTASVALGPVRFAQDVAAPLAQRVGEEWAAGRLSVASEHLASSLLRNLLGNALQPTLSSAQGPKLLFATPSGEPHELGLQLAAMTALGAGANPVYLGADLPTEEIAQAAERSGVKAVALSIVTVSQDAVLEQLRALREAIDPRTHIWIGGRGVAALGDRLPAGIEPIGSLPNLERRVARLRLEK